MMFYGLAIPDQPQPTERSLLMPLQLTGRHMTIDASQKDYINRKVNRLRRMCPKIDEMRFTATKDKLQFKAEATFRAGAIAVRAASTASQPLEAIDLLVDKLEACITKAKDKLEKRKVRPRNGKRSIDQALIEEQMASAMNESQTQPEAEGV